MLISPPQSRLPCIRSPNSDFLIFHPQSILAYIPSPNSGLLISPPIYSSPYTYFLKFLPFTPPLIQTSFIPSPKFQRGVVKDGIKINRRGYAFASKLYSKKDVGNPLTEEKFTLVNNFLIKKEGNLKILKSFEFGRAGFWKYISSFNSFNFPLPLKNPKSKFFKLPSFQVEQFSY